MHWMLMPLRRYAEFSGRSRRKEYWLFVLLNLIFFYVTEGTQGPNRYGEDPKDDRLGQPLTA